MCQRRVRRDPIVTQIRVEQIVAGHGLRSMQDIRCCRGCVKLGASIGYIALDGQCLTRIPEGDFLA
jgi:hypothetical protein